MTMSVMSVMDCSMVPRAGIEPACLAATVFETVASTYSATWAGAARCISVTPSHVATRGVGVAGLAAPMAMERYPYHPIHPITYPLRRLA